MAAILSSIIDMMTPQRQTSSGSMDNKQNVPIPASSVHIVSGCQEALCEVIHCKFGCVATVEGVDFQGDSNTKKKKAPGPPARRLQVGLPSGIQVSVWKGDLTELKVDAVVNAANSQLQHGGGLALALSKAGGPQIKQDSDAYIHKNGYLPTGRAIICSSGKLPCKYLIHAVGPQVTRYSPLTQARPLLEETIRSILEIVVEHRLSTVAIPAISSGLFNYPLADCADTIVKTVKRYFESLSKSRLQSFNSPTPAEIRLVNHDEKTVVEMMKACSRIIGNQLPVPYSQAASSHTRSAVSTSPITVQFGNVLVILRKDRIEEQKTDVIVNTAAHDRNLKSGMISSALFGKAGPKMQQEIDQARPNGMIIHTRPYKLKCKEVFHTFCHERHLKDAPKILFDSVRECLWMTVTRHHTSIAFPAIGTGQLGFSAEEVASIMLKAVSDCAANCKVRLEVHFVIFPTDIHTFEAFAEQIGSLKSKAPPVNVPLALEYPDAKSSKKAEPPHISLMGSSAEMICEARKWFRDLDGSFGQVDIQNNFIQHFGEQEYQQLACLVRNGASVEEFFSNGHACISVSRKSQESVMADILQVEMMLQRVQQLFLKAETREMKEMVGLQVSFERELVNDRSAEFLDVVHPFRSSPLSPIKVDKVENAALEAMFDLKKKQLRCSSTRKMYQCIPAQFCDMVSLVGFHAEVAPPEVPDLGEGIYFTATVEKARKVWKGKKEEYVYFVEAEVLEGDTTRGKPDLILPPPVGTDPQRLFDSVTGGNEVTVVFSGYQALPRYIITCGKV